MVMEWAKGCLEGIKECVIFCGFAAAGFEVKAWLGTIKTVTAPDTIGCPKKND